MNCIYYQARLVREKIWFVVGTLRAETNLVFERALENDRTMFEFFVPPQNDDDFLAFMDILAKRGCIVTFEKKKNRFAHLSAQTFE